MNKSHWILQATSASATQDKQEGPNYKQDGHIRYNEKGCGGAGEREVTKGLTA